MKTILLSLAGAALSAALIPGVTLAKVPSLAVTHQTQSQKQTFIGELTRQPTDRYPVPYILYDPALGSNYFINNRMVAPYNGEKVEITGTLDQTTDTIHVESVKPVN
jgi:hypothetical protein